MRKRRERLADEEQQLCAGNLTELAPSFLSLSLSLSLSLIRAHTRRIYLRVYTYFRIQTQPSAFCLTIRH